MLRPAGQAFDLLRERYCPWIRILRNLVWFWKMDGDLEFVREGPSDGQFGFLP